MSGTGVRGDGVYYFLGNITSHVVHALPLQRLLGGEIVVLSEQARQALAWVDAPVIAIDDLPQRWRRTGRRFTRTDQYLHVPRAARATTQFLEERARVVLFYELFDFAPAVRLQQPRTVFLSHGAPIKPYYSGRDRIRLLREYDHVAALGPHNKQFLLEAGVEPDRVVDLGLARTDEVVARRGPRRFSPEIARLLGPHDREKVFAYLPTFWGLSSVGTVGLRIVTEIPSDHVLLVRLHPQTPPDLVERYRELVRSRPRVFLLEGDAPGLGLLDILVGADAVIGELSSVMLEALLLDKPLLFAVDDDSLEILRGVPPLRAVVDHATLLRQDSPHVGQLLAQAIERGIDQGAWSRAMREMFYDADGTSVRHIAEFVRSL
jgi:hypothetical protein